MGLASGTQVCDNGVKQVELPDSISLGELLRGLTAVNCYPHEVSRVELIETHISVVLLAGCYAYKIKKPVDLGFLDFSTLELRRKYCFEELRLNQRLAPNLYLEVVAITVQRGRPMVAPHGSAGAIEYAVKMRRFEQSALLDHMLSVGELTPRHLDALAATTAAFHSSIARPGNAGEPLSFGLPENIAQPMRQNFTQIRPLLDTADERHALDHLEAWSLKNHARLAPVMAERSRSGFVRECHGDLHLGNIIWAETEIQIFDCIEFNPGLRWIDVASEIAFTVMDLCSRARPGWAWRILNAYLEITGDYAALGLLSYYLVYRAMVRAKVARIRAGQSDGEVRRLALLDYAEHIRLATDFTAPRPLSMTITHGVSGSGKTTITQPLLEEIGALRLRSDVVRKRLQGLKPGARSGSALGSGLYSERLTRATYDELLRLSHVVLEAGFPVIIDATFLRRDQRDAFNLAAAAAQVPFLILECAAATSLLHDRVRRREAEAADASEANHAVLDWQLQHDEGLDTLEMACTIKLEAEPLLPMATILARIAEGRSD